MSYAHKARKKEIKRDKRRAWLEEQAELEKRAAAYKPRVATEAPPKLSHRPKLLFRSIRAAIK